MKPTASIKRVMEIVDQAKTVGNAVGSGGGGRQLGVRNVPTTLGDDWPLRSPGNARPEQFFFAR